MFPVVRNIQDLTKTNVNRNINFLNFTIHPIFNESVKTVNDAKHA